MLLRDFIEAGANKAETLTALGKMLELTQPQISAIKAGKRPMPMHAVIKLADYIGADRLAVIAANELVTEKDEQRRAYWTPFVQHARAAAIALTILSVTTSTTPTPAEAAPKLNNAPPTICIMSTLRSRSRQ